MTSDLISIRGAKQGGKEIPLHSDRKCQAEKFFCLTSFCFPSGLHDRIFSGVNTYPIGDSLSGVRRGRVILRIRLDMFRNGSSFNRTADVPRWFHYLFALLGATIALFIRWLLDPVLGDEIPFIPLCVAVAAVVWLGGWRPAVLTIVAGIFAGDFLFIAPRGTPGFNNAMAWIYAGASFVLCALIAWLVESARRAKRHAE